MKVYDHQWNDHAGDLGLDPDVSWEEALKAAGWTEAWKCGTDTDDLASTITVFFRDDDWLVEAWGTGVQIGLIRCDHLGQALAVIRELAPLINLTRNIWELPSAPIDQRSVRIGSASGKQRWTHQSYLVTTPDDAHEAALRWGQ